MSVPAKRKSRSRTRRGRSHQSLSKRRSSIISKAYARSQKKRPSLKKK